MTNEPADIRLVTETNELTIIISYSLKKIVHCQCAHAHFWDRSYLKYWSNFGWNLFQTPLIH